MRDKTILVRGGTRGIGQTISLRFARAGATVVANYLRNEETAEHLKGIATEERLAITLCRADLTHEKGLEQLDRSLQELPGHTMIIEANILKMTEEAVLVEGVARMEDTVVTWGELSFARNIV